jgi:hypothetical protein
MKVGTKKCTRHAALPIIFIAIFALASFSAHEIKGQGGD